MKVHSYIESDDGQSIVSTEPRRFDLGKLEWSSRPLWTLSFWSSSPSFPFLLPRVHDCARPRRPIICFLSSMHHGSIRTRCAGFYTLGVPIVMVWFRGHCYQDIFRILSGSSAGPNPFGTCLQCDVVELEAPGALTPIVHRRDAVQLSFPSWSSCYWLGQDCKVRSKQTLVWPEQAWVKVCGLPFVHGSLDCWLASWSSRRCVSWCSIAVRAVSVSRVHEPLNPWRSGLWALLFTFHGSSTTLADFGIVPQARYTHCRCCPYKMCSARPCIKTIHRTWLVLRVLTGPVCPSGSPHDMLDIVHTKTGPQDVKVAQMIPSELIP